MPFDARRVRADFPIFGRAIHGRPLAYLDSTASGFWAVAALSR